jgi:hypothetical protein
VQQPPINACELEVLVRTRFTVWIDDKLKERARNASAFSGRALSHIAQEGLLREVEGMENGHPFPPRPIHQLPAGRVPPSGRRVPMT